MRRKWRSYGISDTGVSREASGYVTDLTPADRDDGLTLLQFLSLLNSMKDDRFSMLSIVQEYAEAEIVKADFGKELTERWLGWLVEFTQHYGIDLEWHVERAPTVSSEYPNLLSAIRWCHEHNQWKTLLQLAEGTCFYSYLIGLFGESREILEAAVQASKELCDEQCEGRFMRRLGELSWAQGQHEKALEYLKNAEEVALRYKDDDEPGWVYHIRADILAIQGHLAEAEQLAKTTLERGKQLNSLKLKFLAVYRLSAFESQKVTIQ